MQLDGISDFVMNMNRLCGFHDKGITNVAIHLEDHDSTGRFIREPDTTALDLIGDLLAGLEHRQDVTNGQAVARSAINDDDLVLTDLRDTVHDRNNAAVDSSGRCLRKEI